MKQEKRLTSSHRLRLLEGVAEWCGVSAPGVRDAIGVSSNDDWPGAGVASHIRWAGVTA